MSSLVCAAINNDYDGNVIDVDKANNHSKYVYNHVGCVVRAFSDLNDILLGFTNYYHLPYLRIICT